METSINMRRVILGGLLAGLVGDLLRSVIDLALASRLSFAMQRLGLPEVPASHIVLLNVTGLAWGIATIWLYAAIRPRFGPGPGTAVVAGAALWVMGSLLTMVDLWTVGVWPRGVTVLVTAGDLAVVVVSALAGAALYREAAGAPRLDAVQVR